MRIGDQKNPQPEEKRDPVMEAGKEMNANQKIQGLSGHPQSWSASDGIAIADPKNTFSVANRAKVCVFPIACCTSAYMRVT